MRQVIDEVLRITLIGNTSSRISEEDVQLAGYTIPAKVSGVHRAGRFRHYLPILSHSSCAKYEINIENFWLYMVSFMRCKCILTRLFFVRTTPLCIILSGHSLMGYNSLWLWCTTTGKVVQLSLSMARKTFMSRVSMVSTIWDAHAIWMM